MIVQADPDLLRRRPMPTMRPLAAPAAPMARHEADWDGVNIALDRVLAPMPELTVVVVYNLVSSITDSGVPAY